MSEVSVVEVRPGLFLGTRQHALCARLVSSLRLSHILTLGIEPLQPTDLPSSSIPPCQASGDRPPETQKQDEDQEHHVSNQSHKSGRSVGRSPSHNLKKMVEAPRCCQTHLAEHSVACSQVSPVSHAFSSDVPLGDLAASLHARPQTKKDDSSEERWELCCNFTEPLLVDFDANAVVDDRQPQKLQIDVKETAVASCPPQAFYFLLDEEGADLLGVLPGALDYIDQALAGAGRILVHCESGVSRAPAVIAAWLMFSENVSLPTALQQLRMQRPDAEPNAGFISQLKVMESTGCKFQLSLPIVRQHRLQTLVPPGSTPKELPQGCFAEDPATTSTEGLYRCRRCRRILFKASSLISHLPGSGHFGSNKRHVPLAADTAPSMVPDSLPCSSWFVEPLAWMETSLLGVTQALMSKVRGEARIILLVWFAVFLQCVGDTRILSASCSP
uniref:dual specificity protein phosphatase 12-like isoform X2 n=1 Tax=Myxine glutinosa TaxID=7769 RepID=UPI00358F9B30